jgi:hypothetical protein
LRQAACTPPALGYDSSPISSFLLQPAPAQLARAAATPVIRIDELEPHPKPQAQSMRTFLILKAIRNAKAAAYVLQNN